MAAGLQVWNGSGDLIVDTSFRLARIIDYFTVTGNGSRSYPAESGTLVAAAIEQNWLIRVSTSNTSVSWSSATPAYSYPAKILVMRY